MAGGDESRALLAIRKVCRDLYFDEHPVTAVLVAIFRIELDDDAVLDERVHQQLRERLLSGRVE